MAPVGRATAAAAGLVSWAHDDLELAYREIGLAVKADERTVRRWERREAVPRARHMAKLEELRELRHLLEAVFEFSEQAHGWLRSSVPAFRGRTPISSIRQGKIKQVVEVLATVESGAYL